MTYQTKLNMRDTESEHSTEEVVDVCPADAISRWVELSRTWCELPVSPVQLSQSSDDERERDILIEVLLRTSADI